jgi:hypothetical protein
MIDWIRESSLRRIWLKAESANQQVRIKNYSYNLRGLCLSG